MATHDYVEVRNRIEKYAGRTDLQMLFKAAYLLGAKQCELLAEKFPSDSKCSAYSPRGDDCQQETVLVNNTRINTVFFRIRTARTRGKGGERTVLLPSDCEPWAKQLYAYYKEKGNNPVFPFNRQDIYVMVKRSKVLAGLEKNVAVRTQIGLDYLRWYRKEELEEKYEFKEAHLKAYGIMKFDPFKTPDKQLDESRIEELKKEYLWNLCNPKTEKKNNILFVDGTIRDIDDLIEKGENEKVEFKSSLCWDYKEKRKNKIIEQAVVKAIASFLNSEGGILLIGVKDDKTLLGLEADFSAINKQTEDAFDLHFTSVIENYLGIENRPFAIMRFTERKGKQLAIVVIPKKAPKEVFLTVDGEPYFYIRSGNSSRPLNVKEATAYIRLHWDKQKEQFPIKLTPRYGHFTDYMVSNLAIEVRPEKPIEDCRVTFNGKELLCDDNRKKIKYIHEGGTGLFRIPTGEEKEGNAEVVIFDGEKELKRVKLNDIHG